MDREKGSKTAMVLIYLTMTFGLVTAGTHWADNNHLHDLDAPKSHLSRLDVVCSKDYMTVHMFFESPFHGMVFSQHHQGRCVHVGPRAGVREASFHIRYDSCGTVEDLRGQFHENTLVIQYGEDVLEAWDEAKRLRCEWLESFDKESSKNTLAISDIDIVELNFQGDDIDCWMEVQEGRGPWARQVAGILPIGSPLTLVIAINDHSREFDMRVKRCVASDAAGGNEVPLTDEDGCVLRPSLLTPFAKVRDFGGRATLVAYSHLFAFKFPDSLDVFVHCVVEVCRHGCPDACGHDDTPHPREHHHHHAVETKKENKLVELTTAASVVPKRPQYLTKVPVHVLRSLKKGRNSSNPESYVVTEEDRERFLGPDRDVFSEVKPVPIGQYHKIIGHHAHWDSEAVRLKDEEYLKHHIPPTKEALNHPDLEAVRGLSKEEILRHHFGVTKPVHYEPVPQPQPELDDIRHLKKNDVLHYLTPNHPVHPKEPLIAHGERFQPPGPNPEPAPWTIDNVNPLRKEEVFHHLTPNHPVHPKEPLISHGERFQPPEPNPEPAPWSIDNVNPLRKEEVFHHLTPNLPVHHKEPLVTHKEVFGSHFQPPFQDGANPEPAPWTLDEVRPMINPAIKHDREHFIEPKPEPAATWTLDEVKPLTKEDLKLHSLNYKLKSHPHLADAIPTYKEAILPYSTKSPYTAPSPVYVPQSGVTPKNMSGMMMNMMMMMPTLLPYTYQTAHWPSKTTAHARNIKTNRHHHPYPIPQFTHKQQLMMSVVADRRSDDNDDELQFEMDPRSVMRGNAAKTTTKADMDDATAMMNGLIAGRRSDHNGNELQFEMDPRSADSKSGIGTTTIKAPTTNRKSINDDEKPIKSSIRDNPDPITAKPNTKATKNPDLGKPDSTKLPETGPAAVRPPVVGFIPPSLDIGEINPFETKGMAAHSPRSLKHHRRRRSSEPVFGVRQKFQAVALTDLAFEFDSKQDGTAVLRGRREEVVYGVCMSPASMSLSVGFILLLTLCALMASLLLYEHSYRLRNKTSHLSVLTKTFNGRLEALYRVSRRCPNSSVR